MTAIKAVVYICEPGKTQHNFIKNGKIYRFVAEDRISRDFLLDISCWWLEEETR